MKIKMKGFFNNNKKNNNNNKKKKSLKNEKAEGLGAQGNATDPFGNAEERVDLNQFLEHVRDVCAKKAREIEESERESEIEESERGNLRPLQHILKDVSICADNYVAKAAELEHQKTRDKKTIEQESDALWKPLFENMVEVSDIKKNSIGELKEFSFSNFFKNAKELKALVKQSFCEWLVPHDDWSKVATARENLCCDCLKSTAGVILKHTKDDGEEPSGSNGDGLGGDGKRNVSVRRPESLRVPVIENGIQTSPERKKLKKDTSTLLIPRQARGQNNPERGSNETKPGFGKSGIGESIDVDESKKSMSLDDGDAKNNENNNTTNSAEKKIPDAMETNGDEDEEEIEEDAEEREEREVEELEDMDDLEDKEIATARILQAAKEKKTKYEKLDLLKVKVEFACTSGSLSWRTYVLDMTSWMRGTNERAGFVLEKFQEVLRTEQKTELEKLEGNKEKMAFIVEALENNKEEVLDAMRKEKNAVRVLGERKQKFLTKNAELLGGLSYQECLTISETISLSKENHEMSGFEFGSDKNGDISSVLMDCGDFSVLTDEGEDEKTASFLVRTNEIVQRENEEERAKICALEETFRFYSLQGEHVGLSTLRALKKKEWTILKIRPKAFEHIEFIGPRDCKNFSTEKIFADKAIRGEYLSDEAYMRSVRGFYVCIDRRRQHVKWIIINISACRLIYLEAWLYYDYIVYLATENIIRTLRGQLTFAFDHNGLLDRLRERTTGKALVRKEMRPYGPFPKFKRTN